MVSRPESFDYMIVCIYIIITESIRPVFAIQMAAFPPLLFTVTAVVLLCGALTGEAGLIKKHVPE